MTLGGRERDGELECRVQRLEREDEGDRQGEHSPLNGRDVDPDRDHEHDEADRELDTRIPLRSYQV